MTDRYDVIILGTGEAGIFAAYEMAEQCPKARVLVLDQGRIVQKGTHDELIQQAGIYRDFVSERTESSRWTL